MHHRALRDAAALSVSFLRRSPPAPPAPAYPVPPLSRAALSPLAHRSFLRSASCSAQRADLPSCTSTQALSTRGGPSGQRRRRSRLIGSSAVRDTRLMLHERDHQRSASRFRFRPAQQVFGSRSAPDDGARGLLGEVLPPRSLNPILPRRSLRLSRALSSLDTVRKTVITLTRECFPRWSITCAASCSESLHVALSLVQQSQHRHVDK